MLLKDLQNMNKDKDAKYRVLGKAKTEMVYYLTIKHMLRKYGVPFAKNEKDLISYNSGSTDIAVMNFDALGCVRDQMAMACSDNDAVTYNSDGDVLRYDIDSTIENSILNSESLLKLVQAYIADNSDEAIDSDTLYTMAVERLKKEIDFDAIEGSVAASVKEDIESLDRSYRTATFGMYDKEESEEFEDDERNIISLPLSPLIPEFEKLHKITNLDSGYGAAVSFKAYSRFMQSTYQPNISYNYGIKDGFTSSVDICYKYNPTTGLLSDGFSYDFKSNKRGKRNQKSVTNVVIDNNAFVKHESINYYTTLTAIKDSFVDKLSINLYSVLTKYSQRELTDDDLSLIPVLSRNVLEDMIGNPDEGLSSIDKVNTPIELKSMGLSEEEYFDTVCEYMDEFIENYTSYIETACKHMRNNVHHHEFQIHLQDVTNRYAIATKGEAVNATGKDSVIALYASGDSRGHDYNVAKNQESRFFAVVAHAKYNKQNPAIQPAFGDILGAGYESYAVGDIDQHSKNAENIYVGNEAIERAKGVLLSYDQKKMERFTVIRAASDVENFVNDNGTIAAEALMKTLKDDRDAISAKMQIRFVDDLKDVKQSCNIALRALSDVDSLSGNDLKYVIVNAIQVLSIKKFESQINDQIVYRHLHDNFISTVNEKFDNLSEDMSPTEMIDQLIKIINDVDMEQTAKIACDELFGFNDLICVDKCSQYSAIPYINQIVQLASNLRQCQYVSDMQDLKTRQLNNLDSSMNYLYFTTFIKDVSVDDDVKTDSISGTSDDDTVNDDLENEAEDSVNVIDDAKYRSMFLNPSDDDISWSWINSNDRDAILYRATHPLQYQVFREVQANIKNNDIKMTKNGIIYYADDHEVKFKVGPIVDEEAFIMPVLKDGTKTSEIVIENNVLQNKIRFGALDLKGVGNANVNNRIYGYSGIIDSYDGNKHSDNFTDRINLSTYQMSVMDEVKKCLNLYSIAFDKRERHRGKDGYNIKKNVYMYYQHNFINNVYNTGTYIIENKEKAEIASRYLSNLVHFEDEPEKNPFEGIIDYDAINSDEFFETSEFKSALESHLRKFGEDDDDLESIVEEFKETYRANHINILEDAVVRSVQTYMMQLDMDHSRCVMPKITLDQNIGLYNVALNLGENNMTKMIGKIDRKNLRDSDCKSRRIVGFQDNSKFDAKLTGSAKRLGAILYLAEETEVDRLTGKIYEHGGHYSFIINSGIKDVTGEVVAPVVSFNGGQALDRIQLSVYAQLKGLTYIPGVNFAMINLTDNMEDGYIITKRIAEKLGHFEYNEKTNMFEYVTAVVGDKIGDSESGNKGIISRIIDTDMSREEFIADETRKFFIAHAVSNDGTFDSESVAQVSKILKDYIDSDEVEINADNMFDLIRIIDSLNYRDDIYNKLFEATGAGALNIPKYESCIHNRLAQFLIFKNNPELDIAITNVCVLTRSNPSLLMHIGDKELVVEDTHTGEKQSYVGGIGTCMFYLDSHTAIDKNRRYSDYGAVKGGRSYGAQEMFALDARKCNDDFVKLLIAQDKYMVSKINKLNRRLIMNGLHIDTGNNFRLNITSDNEYTVDDDEIVNQNGAKFANVSETQILDMRDLAKKMLDAIDANLNQSDKSIYKYTSNMISNELQYGVFNSVVMQSKSRESADKEQSIQSANNLIDAWFSYITNVPNTFISIPQSMPDDLFAVYYNSIFTTSDEVDDYTEPNDFYDDDFIDEFEYDDPYYDPGVYMSDDVEFLGYAVKDLWQRRAESLSSRYHDKLSLLFNIDGERYMPLFTSYEYNSSSEDESGISIAKAKTKTQINIFKNVLAYYILEELEERQDKIDDYDSISTSIREAKEYIKGRLVTVCSGISNDNSLTLDDLNSKFKSDIYRFTVSNSYTAVWSGDGGALNLNQVGISFEMAKEMNLIHRTSREPMEYPDTFENMILNGYSQIRDDELVFINRSPGQTTGCIRGLHPVIINNNSRSVKIHPAIATVFDGDFDGDTVGVIHILRTKENSELYEKAMSEAHRTITLETNLIKTAENKVVMSESGEPIEYVNPLFIAGNADIGIGLYYAQQQRDEDGDTVKISKELDEITIRANLLEHYKQLANDLQSSLMYGDVDFDASYDTNAMCTYIPEIIRERLKQIDNLAKYSDDMMSFNEDLRKNSCSGLLDIVYSYLDCVDEVVRDFENAEAQKNNIIEKASEHYDSDEEMLRLFMTDQNEGTSVSTKLTQYVKQLHADFAIGGINAKAIEKARSDIYALEVDEYEHLNDIYTEATAVSNAKCFTAGMSAYEKIEKIVAEANISKKGKAPQLNALLKYSGLYDVLRVDKDKDTGKFMLFNVDGTKVTEDQRKTYCKTLKMDVAKAKADVPVSEHRNENQSNMTAQSDKADATGLGGAVAQKMQKFMSSFGYSEVALMISGPITQRYLDAKQNVAACETNLTVGKYVLDDVMGFRRVVELSNEEFKKYDFGKTRNGQFTTTSEAVSINEGVDQINNLIKMMDLTSDGLEALSPVNQKVVKACAASVVGANGDFDAKVPQFAKNCEEKNNQAYRIMYNSNSPKTLITMAKDSVSIFDGMMMRNARVQLVQKMDEKSISADTKMNTNIDHLLEITKSNEIIGSERGEAKSIAGTSYAARLSNAQIQYMRKDKVDDKNVSMNSVLDNLGKSNSEEKADTPKRTSRGRSRSVDTRKSKFIDAYSTSNTSGTNDKEKSASSDGPKY